MGIPQPMLRLAESKLLFPRTAGHESMLCHPVFGAVSLFFPLSLFESSAVEDIFHPHPQHEQLWVGVKYRHRTFMLRTLFKPNRG